MYSSLGHRVPRGGKVRDCLMCPHATDVDDRTTASTTDHAAHDGLGGQEHGTIQFQVRVVVGLGVVEEILRDEESRCVDQQRCIGVLLRELCLHHRDLAAV